MSRAATAPTGCAPVFAVRDLAASLAWYREKLGFEVSFQWGAPGEAPHYAGVCRGDLTVHLNAEPIVGHVVGGSLVAVFLEDVDALDAELRERGAEIAVPLDTRPYGMRDLRVVDPDGNGLVFGSEVAS